jgi:hypothetical protein
MKGTKKTALLLALALVFSAIAESASAHGRRSRAHIGLYFGVPLGGWGYGAPYYSPFYSPYYYPPTSVVVVPQPQTYIQQDAPAAPAAPAPQAAYWYYCADAQAYYPYVKECPAGWQRVTPQPSN